MSRNVGETCSVSHKVVVHEAAGEALSVIADIELHRVSDVECLELIKACEHDFLSLCMVAAEEVTVRFLALVVENISALVDECLCSRNSLLEIFLSIRHAVVLSPCSLEKGCT